MKEKITTYSLATLGILAGGILAFVGVKYILPVTAPFFIAWAMALATRTPAAELSRKIRVPEKILRLMMSIFLTLFIFGALTLIVWRSTAALWSFLSDIGEGGELYGLLTALTKPSLPIFGEKIPIELRESVSDAARKLLEAAFSRLANAVTSLVGALPRALLFLLVTVIALVYFALDLERINAFVKSNLPKNVSLGLSKFRRGLFESAKKYLRSYALLLLLTYVALLAGFLVLKIRNAAVVALFVSILDVLPVIGVGCVLLPWGVFEIILGNHFLGIGLLVLFVINAVVRQFAEPKLLGKSLNLHPVLMLLLIYVGYALFGLMGLVVLPVIAMGIGIFLQKDHTAEVP